MATATAGLPPPPSTTPSNDMMDDHHHSGCNHPDARGFTTPSPPPLSPSSINDDHLSFQSPSSSDPPTTSSPPPVAEQDSSPAKESLAKEKVLGITILTQLQELDLAIKRREQNKVDGRKTRWIDYRKQQEEFFKNNPESGSARKRRSGSNSRHKKENINNNFLGASPPSSADDSSPTKTEELPSVPCSPSACDNNNTLNKIPPLKFPEDKSNSDNMKMEVAEPLIGSVEPSNVLETMKLQFLQDTTKGEHLDSAKLTKDDVVLPAPDRELQTEKKKKKTIPKVPLLNIAKKKVGRPPKRPKQLDEVLENKNISNKAKGKIKANSDKKNSQLSKDVSINNFFSKQKTRGLREIRKPDGDSTDDPSSLPEDVTSADLPNAEVEPPSLLRTNPPATKCPLIAITASIVSKNSKRKGMTAKLTAKLAIAERKALRLASKIHETNASSESDVKSKKKVNKSVKSAAVVPEEVHKPNDALELSSNASDISETSDISSRRSRIRGNKRKFPIDTHSSSPPPKCSKKTSTVVAEVHNSMNGEPQSTLSTTPKNNTPGRKKKSMSDDSSVPEGVTGSGTHVEAATPSAQLPEAPSHFSESVSSPVSAAALPTGAVSFTISPSTKDKHTYETTSLQRSTVVNKGDQSPGAAAAGPLSRATSMSTTIASFPLTRSTACSETHNSGSNSAPRSFESSASAINPSPCIVNGHSPMKLANSKSIPQVPINTVVPESLSPVNKKKNASPVKLVRTAPLKIPSPSPSKKSPTKTNSPSLPSPTNGGEVQSPDKVTNDATEPVLMNGNQKSSPSQDTLPSSPRRKAALAASSNIVSKTSDSDLRTKSPTGSDCDNNNGSELPLLDSKQGASTKELDETGVKNSNGFASNEPVKPKSDTDKPVGKVPRYLKQLFKDEGVQNMLKSIEEDNLMGVELQPTDSSLTHKLRPKRPPEHSMAISPEPDFDSIIYSSSFSSASSKRRRKFNEAESLYLDEGTLNLLTGIEGSSRRASTLLEQSVGSNAPAPNPTVKTAPNKLDTKDSQENHKQVGTYEESVNNSVSNNNSNRGGSNEVSNGLSEHNLVGEEKSNNPGVNILLVKKKLGRPPKQKPPQQQKSSFPVVDLEAEGSGSKKPSARTDATAETKRQRTESDPLAVRTKAGQDVTPVSDARILSTVNGRVAGNPPSGAHSAKASHAPGGSSSRGSSNSAIKQHSPVRMRREDLPTSPTTASEYNDFLEILCRYSIPFKGSWIIVNIC